MREVKQRRSALKSALSGKSLVVAPGVFDGVSARVADRIGFAALYMTGYGAVASSLGLPDAGIATFTEMAARARMIAGITNTPLIADADTGYGGLLNVQHTVRGYEAAGVCAIQIEDQEFPKKCGHMLGRRVVAVADMVAKIRVACDSRDDPNFLIIARTDARTTHGLDEALHRGEAYARAGADLLFIESPESVDEMERIGSAFDKPLVANMVEGGRTPVLPAAELERIGYRLAIYPALGFLAATAAMETAFTSLRDRRSSLEPGIPLYDFQAMSRLMGFDEVTAFDRKYRDAASDV